MTLWLRDNHLLNIYLLYLLTSGLPIPKLNRSLVINCMNLVSKCIETRGGKPKLSADLQYIKENYYDPVHLAATPLRDKLASSLSWASIEMETAIRNNIICHFFCQTIQIPEIGISRAGFQSTQSNTR